MSELGAETLLDRSEKFSKEKKQRGRSMLDTAHTGSEVTADSYTDFKKRKFRIMQDESVTCLGEGVPSQTSGFKTQKY